MSKSNPINSLDQFAALMEQWHGDRVQRLRHMMQIPEGVEITYHEESGKEVVLSPEQRDGFIAGIVVAMEIISPLPFAVQPVEDEPSEESPHVQE